MLFSKSCFRGLLQKTTGSERSLHKLRTQGYCYFPCSLCRASPKWPGKGTSQSVLLHSVTELTQSKRLNKCWLSGFNKLLHQVQMDRKDFLPFAPDKEACFSPKSWCLPSCVSLHGSIQHSWDQCSPLMSYCFLFANCSLKSCAKYLSSEGYQMHGVKPVNS